jgi:aryl-alcohol dehydrogenase-like predicted oxidoreductase
MTAFADLVRQGKVLYVGVSEWTADEITRGAALARELRIPFVSNQPQYSMLWRVIETEVIPASERAGLGQIVWSPIAQGVLTGKYLPGQPPPKGSRATDPSGSGFIEGFMRDDVLTRAEVEAHRSWSGIRRRPSVRRGGRRTRPARGRPTPRSSSARAVHS